MGIGLTLIFGILIALMPLINNNSKAATEALAETRSIKEIINVKFENIEEKLDIHIAHSQKELDGVKEYIENNRLNHQDLATDLLQRKVIKELKLRNGAVN